MRFTKCFPSSTSRLAGAAAAAVAVSVVLEGVVAAARADVAVAEAVEAGAIAVETGVVATGSAATRVAPTAVKSGVAAVASIAEGRVSGDADCGGCCGRDASTTDSAEGAMIKGCVPYVSTTILYC